MNEVSLADELYGLAQEITISAPQLRKLAREVALMEFVLNELVVNAQEQEILRAKAIKESLILPFPGGRAS